MRGLVLLVGVRPGMERALLACPAKARAGDMDRHRRGATRGVGGRDGSPQGALLGAALLLLIIIRVSAADSFRPPAGTEQGVSAHRI